MSADVVATRRQLHGIAESFLAGPQYRATGTIRLAVRPDGFTATTLAISVHGDTLVWPDGSLPLAGRVRDLAAATGLDVGPPPATVYHSVAALQPDTVLDIDAGAADAIYRSLYAGGFAIKAVLPEAHPVLWPEHLDVAATVEEVNYGVSAGDDFHELPYAYVGPWDFATAPRTGALWNAPFGAVWPLDLTVDVDALATDIADFFRRGINAVDGGVATRHG
ncbi:hypothetical protein [Mycolicibacterium rhodesiae]|uniref:Uncharacterized protein n=1 Tax=Mycolicibacterium rhodesiae TaxID=36814 RepID=A0A1X0IT00_MYCRH|nr:hypothetical protein [Mycolicibacterium rhodesiae]MCV7344146.1 hypothetical protein [Mycolicibacterium rhodesiae]ORB51736.1 hypothetical protein BST42_16345 [Mycolicibacterium rhodesiae]